MEMNSQFKKLINQLLDVNQKTAAATARLGAAWLFITLMPAPVVFGVIAGRAYSKAPRTRKNFIKLVSALGALCVTTSGVPVAMTGGSAAFFLLLLNLYMQKKHNSIAVPYEREMLGLFIEKFRQKNEKPIKVINHQ